MSLRESQLREVLAGYPEDDWMRIDIETLLEEQHEWPHEDDLRDKLIAVLLTLLPRPDSPTRQ